MRTTKFSIKRSDLRINLILAGFVLASAVIIVRLFFIQVVNHNEYKAMAQEQYWNLQEIPAKRGDILSSDGYPLATTQVSYLLYVEPKLVVNKVDFTDRLAAVLAEFNKFDLEDPYKFHRDKIWEATNMDLYWVKIINNLSPDEKQKIEELQLEGMGFEEEPLRYYPEKSLGAHVLGFVASDEEGEKKGYFGIEGSFDGDLRGKPGRIVEERDALGAPILVGGYTRVDPIDGRDVVLTIDRNVQYIVDQHLKEGVINHNALSGSVIVMDPNTGSIIAMSNYPTYDPANFNDFGTEMERDGKRKPVERRNLAISQTYEPGSVLKALTVASAVDMRKVTPDTTFVDNGPVQYSDYVIDNWDGKHHGVQTVVQLLQKSNNIGAAWVGHQVGSEGIYDYFTKFGLGSITGVDLEGEDTGIMRPHDTWTDIDLATISFGQGVSATPLQVLNAFNAIANGGLVMQPRIVSKVIDNGEEIDIPVKISERVITKDTSETMIDMLTSAVEGGESRYFNLKTYDIAGKTGTAQIPFEGKYDPNRTNATFVGFLANSKKFSMIVKLQEPESSIYAAETAVPLWMSIADDLVKYYGIPIDNVIEEPMHFEDVVEDETLDTDDVIQTQDGLQEITTEESVDSN